MLRAVHYQLSLFIVGNGYSPAPVPLAGDGERDSRTGRQWLQSALDYCLWRAGEGWRRLSSRAERESAERWHYLNAARLISTILASGAANSQRGPRVVAPTLPPLFPEHVPDKTETKLAQMPRAELVSALLEIDATLTDRRILSHFTRAKLARMLRERQKLAHQAERRRTA